MSLTLLSLNGTTKPGSSKAYTSSCSLEKHNWTRDERLPFFDVFFFSDAYRTVFCCLGLTLIVCAFADALILGWDYVLKSILKQGGQGVNTQSMLMLSSLDETNQTDSLSLPAEAHADRAKPLIESFSCHPRSLKAVPCIDALCIRMKPNCVMTHHPHKMNICSLYLLHIPGPRMSESIQRHLASSLHISTFQKNIKPSKPSAVSDAPIIVWNYQTWFLYSTHSELPFGETWQTKGWQTVIQWYKNELKHADSTLLPKDLTIVSVFADAFILPWDNLLQVK